MTAIVQIPKGPETATLERVCFRGRRINALVAAVLIFVPLACAPALHAMTLSTGPFQEYLFVEGKKHFDEGNLDAAAATWANILPDKLFGPVAYLLLAGGYASSGKLDTAEAQLRELFDKHSEGVYKEVAQEALTEVLFRQKKPEAVEPLKRRLAATANKDKPPLMLKLAQLERRLGNNANAAEYYRKLFLENPARVEGLKAGEELAWMVVHGAVPRPDFSQADQSARARRLFAAGRFDLASEAYRALLTAKPDDENLRLKLAQCLYKNRRNHDAVILLKEILKGKISERTRMEALFLLSKVYWRLDRSKEFEACCDEILKNGPSHLKRRVLFYLGASALERGKLSAADARFGSALKLTSSPSTKVDIMWKMAWIRYLSKDYKRAAQLFHETRNVSRNGRIDLPSRYWEARSLQNVDRSKEAEALFKHLASAAPLNYYGIEAARILKALGVQVSPTAGNGKKFPDTNLTPAQNADPRISAANKLMDMGLHKFALLNLEALPNSMKSSPAVALLMAKAAHGAERYREAQDILAKNLGSFMETPPSDAPLEFVEIAFPRVHRDVTAGASKKHAVDPNLVWAVIRQESRYDASAVSPAGALGLMQVTPKAAGVVTRRGKIPPSAIGEILDPKRNIAIGTRILAKNLETFKGKLVPAIASYNADIRKVKTWVKRNGKMKQDEFVESIPYLETRNYVKKVLAGYRAYNRLHKKSDLAGLW